MFNVNHAVSQYGFEPCLKDRRQLEFQENGFRVVKEAKFFVCLFCFLCFVFALQLCGYNFLLWLYYRYMCSLVFKLKVVKKAEGRLGK